MYRKRMSNSLCALIAIIGAISFLTAAPCAAAQQADAKAVDAFRAMVKSYRDRPALGVKSKVELELKQNDVVSKGNEVEASFVFGKNRQAVVEMRGYTCYLTNGELTAVHGKNEHSYYRGSDDGSPYYALFNAFISLPFPHLAIFIGEDALEDLYLQIQPASGDELIPSAIVEIEKDGATLQQLTMTGENSTFEILLDPKTKLMQSADLIVTGGPMVQQGVTMTYHHTFEYETFDEPLPAERFAFEPKGRQRVTMLATLAPAPEPVQMPEGGAMAGGPGGHGGLEGQAAPAFTLSTLDGNAVDLGELKGQVVVIDFWATWCKPCIAVLPSLHNVAKWAHESQLPVKVYAVNTFQGATLRPDTPDGRLNAVRTFWNEKQFSLPVLMDYTDETAASYGVSGIPSTVIIRADGVVHAMHVGASPNYEQQLKDDITGAIEALAGEPD